MAILNGMSIKSLKHYEGMEGITYQGNLYLGNKKIGFWSQDGNGGPDWFDFDPKYSEDKFEHLVEATHAPHCYADMEIPFSGEFFMCELLDLTLCEKEYNKYIKKGYDLVIRAGSEHLGNYFYAFRNIQKDEAVEHIRNDLQPRLDALPALQEQLEFDIFSSPDAFVKGEPYSIYQIEKEE